MLRNDPGRAFYGFKHCEYANEHKAIDTLLITDELVCNNTGKKHCFSQYFCSCALLVFNSVDVIFNLWMIVKPTVLPFMSSAGCQHTIAQVFILSARHCSLHPSGEQLQQLTGVAAILRYALDDPNDEERCVLWPT